MLNSTTSPLPTSAQFLGGTYNLAIVSATAIAIKAIIATAAIKIKKHQ
jgi:hypothetical protein